MSGTTTTPATATYEFDATLQTEIVASLMWDAEFAKRTEGHVKPGYFENAVEGIFAELAIEHWTKYHETPASIAWKTILIDAVKTKRIPPSMKLDAVAKLGETSKVVPRNRKWLMDKVAEFGKQQAVIAALLTASEEIFKTGAADRFEKAEKLLKGAFGMQLASDSDDYDYFARIEERTKHRQDVASGVISPTGITTGIPELDALLFHKGWGRKELSLIMGGAKAGKSFFLGFAAAHAVKAGYNVLHVTLENSKEVAATRHDAFFSGIGMSEHLASPVSVEVNIKNTASLPTVGKLHIREFPTGTFRPMDLRRLLDEYKGAGVRFQLVVIDYIDIMAPDHRYNEARENSKSILESVRAVAQEEELAMLSAIQTNREGHKSTVAKAEHAAEDFNKIRVADVVLSINRTEDERAEGKLRITFAACRNQPDGSTLFCKADLDRALAVSEVESVE